MHKIRTPCDMASAPRSTW